MMSLSNARSRSFAQRAQKTPTGRHCAGHSSKAVVHQGQRSGAGLRSSSCSPRGMPLASGNGVGGACFGGLRRALCQSFAPRG